MPSCAAWLSWKCQLTAGTAREHVRVARALRDLPVIRAEFGAGRLSYAKVRALTRIAVPATEAGLAEMAGPMTGNQLERFARAHRRASAAEDATARVRRRLAWRVEEDGSLSGTFRLPPAAGAVLLKALRAVAADLEHPHDDQHGDVSTETSAAVQTSSSLADALVAVAEAFLAGEVAGAEDAEVYQVIVHVGTDALTEPAGVVTSGHGGGVSAETPGRNASSATRPASPGPGAPYRSTNRTAGPIGYASTTPSMPHDRPRQNSGSPVGAPDRRRRPRSTKVMSTGLMTTHAAQLNFAGPRAERSMP
jgi:Domain of unknown function (DUF222)